MATKSVQKREADGKCDAPPQKKQFGHWSQGLKSSMDDPELRIDADEKIVIIKDKYPKAKFHFLLLPKISIPNLKSLTKEHVELLQHIEKKGKALAKKSDPNLEFRFGYHAVPSMSLLHMHVISQDFDSPCLKNKKHWNSFTTEYFVDSSDIIKQLQERGRVELDTSRFQEMLKRNLRCHVCKKDLPTIPALKTHIKLHSYSKKS
ncbi:hypothetical protein ScPMuIL_017989 [Solemya velum]